MLSNANIWKRKSSRLYDRSPRNEGDSHQILGSNELSNRTESKWEKLRIVGLQSERCLPQLNVESRVAALGGLELNLVSLVVLADVNDHRLLERLG